MEFLINDDELNALCGLPHMQQLAYLRGIRPYMDVRTKLVGIKRGISYQSIAEQLYVEAHQGIKSNSCSRMQIRRSLSALERVRLISFQSQGLKLILKCELATTGFSVKNKVDLNPTHQIDLVKRSQHPDISGDFSNSLLKTDIGQTPKADTPLIENNYIYLLSQFEKFWSIYPEKKSKTNAWQAFQQLNPEPVLFNKIIQVLEIQIKNREAMRLNGQWVPPWKYPVNWLLQQCWQDEITVDAVQEIQRAELKTNTRKQPARDMFCPPCDSTDDQSDEYTGKNVIQFRQSQQ